ncbi:MAG: hypothetical protein M0036_13740 [Desulfobacteraceae bacterium]|nr:hypothetical protein [Desulfobacteraceae bacterium]
MNTIQDIRGEHLIWRGLNQVLTVIRIHGAKIAKHKLFAYICLAAVIGVAVSNRVFLQYEFPIPWNDETAFIAQSISLADNGSFYTYGLNANRDLMWMPPGYMILLAAAFKIFGYGYDLSRWISVFLYIGSVLLCFAAIQSQLTGWHKTFACIVFAFVFITPYVLVISNIARMEALYMFLFLLAMHLTLNQKYGHGLSVVLVAALVHFNAIYFLFPFLFYLFWLVVKRRAFVIAPSEIVSLFVAGLLLLLYLNYISMDFQGFLSDMAFQFSYKDSFGPAFGGRKGIASILFLTCIIAAMGIKKKEFSSGMIISLFGVSFLMLGINGRGHMWYEFSFSISVMLFSIASLISIEHSDIHIAQYIGGGVFIASILALMHFGHTCSPLQEISPHLSTFKKHFLQPDEIKRVNRFLEQLPAGTKVTFGYTGVEPLFFSAFRKSGAVWTANFNSMTQPFPLREVDYIIICDSSMYPQYLLNYDFDGYKRRGENSGCQITAAKQDPGSKVLEH